MFDFFGWKKEVEEIRKKIEWERGQRELVQKESIGLQKQLTEAKAKIDLLEKQVKKVEQSEAELLAENQDGKAELDKLKKDLETACQNLRAISAALAHQIVLRQRVEKLNKDMLEQINLYSVPKHVMEIQIP